MVTSCCPETRIRVHDYVDGTGREPDQAAQSATRVLLLQKFALEVGERDVLPPHSDKSILVIFGMAHLQVLDYVLSSAAFSTHELARSSPAANEQYSYASIG